jgi:AcrR family transcriptional regulator
VSDVPSALVTASDPAPPADDDVTVGDRRPGRPRDVRIDASIESATIEELCERGFGGASIEGIAARAGVGKATIYRRFPSREALLFSAAVHFAGECEAPDTGSLRDDLVGLWISLMNVFADTIPGRMLSDLLAEATRNPELMAMVQADMASRRTSGLAAVERARARGEIGGEVDADTLLDAVTGPFFYRTVFQTGDLDRAMGERLIDQVLGGVLAAT